MKRRTLKYWYNILPEPYRTQAIANVRRQGRTLRTEARTVMHSIDSFSWLSTPEGHDYWSSFNNDLYYRRIKLNLPAVPVKGFGVIDKRFINWCRKLETP